jgi:hypothetical protein
MSKPETITIDEVKYIRADSVKKETIKPTMEGDFLPFEIGAIYFIRTVTMIQVGRVVAASHRYLVLEEAAWVASTGRFADALRKWEFNEVEPFPDHSPVIVMLGAGVDAQKAPTTAKTLRSQK